MAEHTENYMRFRDARQSVLISVLQAVCLLIWASAIAGLIAAFASSRPSQPARWLYLVLAVGAVAALLIPNGWLSGRSGPSRTAGGLPTGANSAEGNRAAIEDAPAVPRDTPVGIFVSELRRLSPAQWTEVCTRYAARDKPILGYVLDRERLSRAWRRVAAIQEREHGEDTLLRIAPFIRALVDQTAPVAEREVAFDAAIAAASAVAFRNRLSTRDYRSLYAPFDGIIVAGAQFGA
jgi:hypothetical protein